MDRCQGYILTECFHRQKLNLKYIVCQESAFSEACECVYVLVQCGEVR